MNKILELLSSLDYKGIVAEYVFHRVADLAFERMNQSVTDTNEILKRKGSDLAFKLTSREETVIKQIVFNVKKAHNWCSNVSFKDAPNSKTLNQIYVDLDYYVSPKSLRFEDFDDVKLPFNSLLENIESNTVILGGPGAGKTTLMKSLCFRVLNEQLYKNIYSCPIVIRFRELRIPKNVARADDFNLYSILKDELGIVIDGEEISNIPSAVFEKEYRQIIKRLIIDFIEESRLLIILDGYDEIPNALVKKSIKRDLEELSLSLDHSKFVITSRTGDFDIDISNSETYEVCPLSKDQIKDFVKKWLVDSQEAEDLYQQIMASPFADTVVRPLTLAHLCAIYERYRKIPVKPKSVYSKVVQLLLEEWDSQRSIERVSNYASFEIDRKIEFLAKLAYVLTTRFNATSFDKTDLESAYQFICSDFDLPVSQMKKVVNEIESHNGLFLQTGIESYEFAHKSIQEFLTAKYIVGLPEIPSNFDLLKNLANELAIAVAISSDPNMYLGHLLLNKIKKASYSTIFFKVLFSRLLIEKPDFNDKPILFVAISHLYYTMSRPENARKSEADDVRDVFLLFQSIFQQSNIIKSLKKFNKIYKFETSHELYDMYSYSFRDPNLSLGERNFLPFNLLLNKSSHEYLKANL